MAWLAAYPVAVLEDWVMMVFESDLADVSRDLVMMAFETDVVVVSLDWERMALVSYPVATLEDWATTAVAAEPGRVGLLGPLCLTIDLNSDAMLHLEPFTAQIQLSLSQALFCLLLLFKNS